MSLNARRTRQRRRHQVLLRVGDARLRRAPAVVAVTAETELLVDPFAALERGHLRGRERRTAAAGAGQGVGRRQNLLADLLDPSRRVGGLRRGDDALVVGNLEQIEGQQRLDDDVGVGIPGELPVVIGQRFLSGLVQRLAGADRLNPHLRAGVFHQLAHERRRQGPEPLDGPQCVEPRIQVVGAACDLRERRNDRRVLLEDEQLLRGVTPPSIRVAEVRDQLRCRLVQHPRPRAIAVDAVVCQAPDAAVAHDLVELILLDLFPQVGAGLGPFAFLDDAAVHVRDVERAVGRNRLVDGAEQRVGGANELGSGIDVAQLRQSFGDDRAQPPHDARDHFAVQIIAEQLLGQTIAAEDGAAGAGRRAGERTIRHAHDRHAALHVRDGDRGAPRRVQAGLEAIGDLEVAVVHRKLEVTGHAAGAPLEVHLPEVVLRHTPLRAVRAGRLALNPVRRPAHAEGVIGAVHPVVHPPGEMALLVFDVAGAPEIGREQLLAVSDAVVVRIGELPHLVGIRFHRQDRVLAEREYEPREHELVDEHRVLLVDAVVVDVLVDGNAADRLELAARIGVLHVAADLEHEHAAVAVEGDLRRLLDLRIGQHRLQLVAGRQQEPFLFVGRGERTHR